MGRKLYVGNLPYETNEQDLQELFAQAGSVETVTVMRDRDTGRARGFAFVEMSSDDDAQNAITKLNDQQFGGRRLTVNEARPQVPRSGGGGGGGVRQSRSLTSQRASLVDHASVARRPRSGRAATDGVPGPRRGARQRSLWCRFRRRTCEVIRLATGSLNRNTERHDSARRRTPHRHRLRRARASRVSPRRWSNSSARPRVEPDKPPKRTRKKAAPKQA